MRKRSYGTLLGTGLAATVLAVGLTAAPSLATTATTWTVKPGGSFFGSSGKVTFTDTTTKVEMTCTSSSISGKLKSGSGLSGTHIASITALSFSGCKTIGDFLVAWATGEFPYHLNAASYDAPSGETTSHVTGIAAALSGGGCMLTMAGTTDTTLGTIEGKYTNSTHKLVTSGGTLHVWNVGDGCEPTGLIWDTGDHVTISATYAVTPAQKITSP